MMSPHLRSLRSACVFASCLAAVALAGCAASETGPSGSGGSSTPGDAGTNGGGTAGTGGSGAGGTSGVAGTTGSGGSAAGTTGSAGTGEAGSGGSGGSAVDCNAMLPSGGTAHSSSNQSGTAGGMSWSIWTNSGPGTITTFTTPAFSASWNGSGDFLARIGLQFGNSGKAVSALGTVTAQYTQ